MLFYKLVIPNIEFKPPENIQKIQKQGGLSRRAKLSITVGAVILVLCLAFTITSVLWWKGFFGGSSSREKGAGRKFFSHQSQFTSSSYNHYGINKKRNNAL